VTALRYQVADTLLLGKRNLLRFRRSPELVIGFLVQPVMFILLFVYVLGGAIQTPGFADYTDFLMPGIIVQTISFGGFVTAIALAEDMQKGLIDRFRSLPIARSTVLAGRTISDVVTNTAALAVMITVGLLVGFNFSASALEIVAGILLLLLFGYAFSWIFALMGLSSSTPEAAQQVGFILIFPLTFASSAFVPVDSMPSWLQGFAEVNPFTTVVDAMRALWVGTPAGNSIWGAVAWSVGLIAVFAPIATWRYKRTVSE
jgi:ABC-2 type transport system permease protein/oleandomycin transport system permease protein